MFLNIKDWSFSKYEGIPLQPFPKGELKKKQMVILPVYCVSCKKFKGSLL